MLRIKTLLLVLLFGGLASAQTPSQAVPKTYFGIHTSNYSTWPQFLGALGKGTLTNWQYSEPQRGVFNWRALDAWVAAAQKHGVTLTYANGGIPKWAVNSSAYSQCKTASKGSTIVTCKAMVADIADWDKFWTALATRYKGKLIYELWNEPSNNPGYLTTQDMVTLTTHEYDIIRSIDPTAKIFCCAFQQYNNYDYMNQYFAAGGVTQVDGISFHGIFHVPPSPSGEAIINNVKAVRQIMAKYGLSGKPLWDSEGGWAIEAPPSSADQPGWVAKWFLLQWSQGVQRSYWYGWNFWRPLWSSSGVNSAGVAYEQIGDWMMGATLKPCTTLSDGSTWTCPLSRASGYQGLVVWNANGNKSYTPQAIYYQYRTLAGSTVHVTPGKALTITRTPIVLETFTP